MGKIPKVSIKKMMKGYFSPHQLKIYMIFSGTITAALLTITLLLYPRENNFGFSTTMMSHLGDWTSNPKGWYFFSIFTSFICFSSIPIFLYVKRKLGPLRKKKVKYGVISGIISMATFFLIAIFADVDDIYLGSVPLYVIHTILAGLGVLFHLISLVNFTILILNCPILVVRVPQNEKEESLLNLKKKIEQGKIFLKKKLNITPTKSEQIDSKGQRNSSKRRSRIEKEGNLSFERRELIKDLLQKKPNLIRTVNFDKVKLAVYVFVVLFFGTVLTQIYGEIFLEYPYTGICSRPLWEWLLFFDFFPFLYGMASCISKGQIDIDNKSLK